MSVFNIIMALVIVVIGIGSWLEMKIKDKCKICKTTENLTYYDKYGYYKKYCKKIPYCDKCKELRNYK